MLGMNRCAAAAAAAVIAAGLGLTASDAQAAYVTQFTIDANESTPQTWDTLWQYTVDPGTTNEEILKATGDWALTNVTEFDDDSDSVIDRYKYYFSLTLTNLSNAGAELAGWGFSTDPTSSNFAMSSDDESGWYAHAGQGVMDVDWCSSPNEQNCTGGQSAGIETTAGSNSLAFLFEFESEFSELLLYDFTARFQSTGVDNEGSETLTAVPLPAAGWLLITGLAGLGFAARRRRAAAA